VKPFAVMRMKRAASAPVPWTPASVSTHLWIDVSDAASRSLSGAEITQLTDKSGAGNTFTQGTSTKRPTLVSADLNGLDTASFDGTDDAMGDGTNTVGKNVSALVCAALFNPDTVNADRRVFNCSTGSSSSAARLLIGFNSSSQFRIGGRRTDAGTYAEDVAVSASSYAGQWTIVLALFDYANATLTVRINGAQESTGAFLAVGSTSNSDSVSSGLGSNTTANAGYFDGKLAEMTVQPSLADVEKIEGYLAHKWGLTSLLPALHPYKSVAP